MTSEENINYHYNRTNSNSSQDKKSIDEEISANEKAIKDEESEVESLRRLIAPLSKEQLIDILATSALIHQDIRDKCNEAVASSPSTRRLMVRNIPFSTRDEQFLKYFETFGEIEDGIIVREKEGRSKGYGFVTFKYVESVQKCLKSSHTLDNKELQVPNTFNYPISFVPNIYTNVPHGYQLNYPANLDSFNAFYSNTRY
ncbi:rna-binding protein [Plasmodium cynomolgi strain B]|uniref:Rna-binding protein n=1 Tax=Plasmodium cynomolgi (strain B) TaxID=1120755 RepID=K6UD01_PLACD|nr:rna-binding protein [Plasmodium cynomolgi strain B]GAB65741.1 rna-binding protein [Plasmodium cynomolgi strain B]